MRAKWSVALAGLEFSGNLNRGALVVHDEGLDIDRLVHCLVKRAVKVDDRVAAVKREAAVEPEQPIVGVVAEKLAASNSALQAEDGFGGGDTVTAAACASVGGCRSGEHPTTRRGIRPFRT
jgi:hypothetical protein